MPSRHGRLVLIIAASTFTLAACSKTETDTAANTTTSTAASGTEAPVASGAPAADNVDTVDGAKLASFTGDATKGEAAFLQCTVCHQLAQNGIGPQLHGVVGRKAGAIPDFNYSQANKKSGITWTPEKLFQFIERPQRVVPGTKMTFAGVSDAQKRADIIAYLKAN